MATYLVLSNSTDQGIKDVKDSPRRLDAGRALARTFGVEVTDFYMTIGAYDMVARLEATKPSPSISSLCVPVGRFGQP